MSFLEQPHGQPRLVEGARACALGALAAGARLFAAVPAAPVRELAETLAAGLPAAGGRVVWLEDEAAALSAALGASLGGVKALTATGSAGFVRLQGVLDYAAAGEVPCVVVDVVQGGLGAGLPTRSSQGDTLLARWGGSGDRPLVVLAPTSVAEVFNDTVRAFALAERLRLPVVVLLEQQLAQLAEVVTLPQAATVIAAERTWAAAGPGILPYGAGDDPVPPMTRPGAGQRVNLTGLAHGADGWPTQDPAVVGPAAARLSAKLEQHAALIAAVDKEATADAEVLVVAYGLVARAARVAVRTARAKGIAAGLLVPRTLWPFPAEALAEASEGAQALLVPELNQGQLALEVERLAGYQRVTRLNRFDGEPITPDALVAEIERVARHDRR